MTNYKRGDVVLVEFEFAEGIGAKRRPALYLDRDLGRPRALSLNPRI